MTGCVNLVSSSYRWCVCECELRLSHTYTTHANAHTSPGGRPIGKEVHTRPPHAPPTRGKLPPKSTFFFGLNMSKSLYTQAILHYKRETLSPHPDPHTSLLVSPPLLPSHRVRQSLWQGAPEININTIYIHTPSLPPSLSPSHTCEAVSISSPTDKAEN